MLLPVRILLLHALPRLLVLVLVVSRRAGRLDDASTPLGGPVVAGGTGDSWGQDAGFVEALFGEADEGGFEDGVEVGGGEGLVAGLVG